MTDGMGNTNYCSAVQGCIHPPLLVFRKLASFPLLDPQGKGFILCLCDRVPLAQVFYDGIERGASTSVSYRAPWQVRQAMLC